MREMKDSGVEWIGEIPKEWCIKKFKYYFSIIGGNGFKEIFQGQQNGDIPFCKASDINGTNKYVNSAKNYVTKELAEQEKYNIIQPNSILIAKIGEALKKNHRKINTMLCIVDNNCEAFTLKENDDINYLYYVMYIIDMIWFDNGGTIPSVNNEKLKNFFLPNPCIIDQQKISTYLDTKCTKIDSIIEKQEKVIEKLKEYKLSVITEAVTKGLNPDVKMKDSGVEWIGEIPEEWEVTKFKYLSLEIGDGIHTTPEYDSAGTIYFINGNNIGLDNLIFKDNTNTINEEEYKNYKLPLLTTDTILITLNGATYGKTSFYNNEKVLLGKSAGYITLKAAENKRFVRYYLQSNAAKLIMEISLLGSTIANLSLNTLKNFLMPYPKSEEQHQIANYLDKKCSAIDKSIEQKQAIIEKLKEYKKSLIYEVVTGKREV